jgi:hypothetical protein
MGNQHYAMSHARKKASTERGLWSWIGCQRLPRELLPDFEPPWEPPLPLFLPPELLPPLLPPRDPPFPPLLSLSSFGIFYFPLIKF